MWGLLVPRSSSRLRPFTAADVHPQGDSLPSHLERGLHRAVPTAETHPAPMSTEKHQPQAGARPPYGFALLLESLPLGARSCHVESCPQPQGELTQPLDSAAGTRAAGAPLCAQQPAGEPVLCGRLDFCIEDGCLPTSVGACTVRTPAPGTGPSSQASPDSAFAFPGCSSRRFLRVFLSAFSPQQCPRGC